MAISDVLALLVCPRCREPFAGSEGGRSVRCRRGHAYDLARQGYLNLLGAKAPRHADTAGMVAARDRFLTAGHYAPLAGRILDLVRATERPDASPEPSVVEVGAGTGYYLAALLDSLPRAVGIAVDVSVPAARRAAGAHPRVGSVVADVWAGLPVADGRAGVLLDVFAPRNPAEFRRLLSDQGLLVVATPEPEHLRELRSGLGLLEIQPDKAEQLQGTLGRFFTQSATEAVRYAIRLDRPAVRDLVAMGPNAFHLSEAEIGSRVAALPEEQPVSVAVRVSSWRPRPAA